MDLLNIVVTGPEGCGKTTFLQTASEIPVISMNKSFPKEDPRHFLEFGRLSVTDEIFLYLVSTPIGEEFRQLWNRAGLNLAGFILIVGESSGSLEAAKATIELLESVDNFPLVIAANQIEDTPAALKKIRDNLDLKNGQELVAVNAKQKNSVKNVIVSLLSSRQKDAIKKSA